MWFEVKMKSWAEYEKIISGFPREKYIYRGQADSNWSIVTSLFREFDKIHTFHRYINMDIKFNYLQAERLMTKEFMSSYNLYSTHNIYEPKESDLRELELYYLEAWSLMQQYGAPTRLLDWTYSPYVAAFFAVDGATLDFSIYALKVENILLRNKEQVQDNDIIYKPSFSVKQEQSFFKTYDPLKKSERLRRQQGLFLVSNKNYESFDETLKNYKIDNGRIFGEGEIVAYKFIFPRKLILDTWDNLQRMNINHETLYAGLEGFSRSIRLGLLDLKHINDMKPIKKTKNKS